MKGFHYFLGAVGSLVSVVTCPAAVPAAPTDVRHTANSPAHLRVEWTDHATDETGYRIWRREAGKEWTLAGVAPIDATHFDDGGLQEKTAYDHKVAAFNRDGKSEEVVTASPPTTPAMEQHLKPQVIIPAGKTYPMAPSAIGLKGGTLLLAYATGDAEQHRKSWGQSLWQMTSPDGGKTWSTPRQLIAGDRQTVYGKPALVRMADGRLGMSYSVFGVNEAGKINARKRCFVTSADEAATWSQPVTMADNSSNNDTLIVGNGGRLMQALAGNGPAARITVSDDNGATWRTLSEVSTRQGALPTGEAALASLGGGRVTFLSRHESMFYSVNLSADNGATWLPNPLTLWCGGGDNPPKLVRLPGPGTQTLAAILHTWQPGRKSKDRRQLASMISTDGGRTWDNFRLIGFAPNGKDGFLQHSLTFIGDTGYLFYGGGSSKDTNDGKDLRLLRLTPGFFTSTEHWPYDAAGHHSPGIPR